MNCPKCNATNSDDAKFCANCGEAMIPASTGTPPSDGGEHASAIPEFAKTIVTPGLIARVKGIILSPATEWPLIDAETTSSSAIYTQYVAPLAAIGVIAGFIGTSLVGTSMGFLGTYRTPLVSGLVMAAVIYALTFLIVFVLAQIIDAFAPTFGGQKDSLRALKVAAYSSTPGWIAGVLQILPSLAIIGLIATLYGIYLLYLGLPALMRSPKDKAIGYTAVVCVCAIVLYIIIGAIGAAVVGSTMRGAFGAHPTFSQSGDSPSTGGAAALLSGAFGAKSDADRQRVADATQALANMGQQAQNAAGAAGGNPAGAKPVDTGAALNAIGTIMSGGSKVKPVDFHALKALLPDSLPGMTRSEASAESNQAMGISAANATAHYGDGNGKSVTVEITDMGSLSGFAALATKINPNLDRETDTGFERTTQVNGQLVHEQYDNRSKSGEVNIIAASRFSVTVRGSGVDMDFLAATLKQIDFGKLASLSAAN